MNSFTSTTNTYGRPMFRCICGRRVGENLDHVEQCPCYTNHVQRAIKPPSSYRAPTHFRVRLDVEAMRKEGNR